MQNRETARMIAAPPFLFAGALPLDTSSSRLV
jgi:hypothetical protein